ncbi:MAG: Long-chain-fatty-acid--CoA ligase FadD15 [Turneriella sp.]|nr:Long-chain-fatty-acid--CoA ligase FadD15 [Turneriella sp.]
MAFNNLNEVFYYANDTYGSREMFFGKDAKKEFVGVTFGEALKSAENVAIALMDMGVVHGEKIGYLADNRVEWIIGDMASILVGGCTVPRGTDVTLDEIKYIMSHAECRFCFVENDATLKKLESVIKDTKVEKIVVLDPKFKGTTENIFTLAQLIDAGAKKRKEKLPELKKRAASVTPDDLFTIIYTSGTTGLPKGVMLSHGNIVYNINEVPKAIGLRPDDSMLSLLPVWHIFERAVDYGAIAKGIPIYYTNVRDVRDDFAKVKPTFMPSAPRLWESLYQGIEQRIQKSEPARKMLFDAAYAISKAYKKAADYLAGNELQMKPETDFERLTRTVQALFVAANLHIPARLADRVVFSKIREAMGGRFRGSISGGGALPAHVDEFFNVIGIPVYEGYGMTECAPIISVRTEGRIIQGSVGFVPNGTEVAILNEKGERVKTGEKGVIHVRGPQIMKGYYKNPEATEKTISKDGWLNTGDIGFFSFNNTLSIRGRAKETIVLLGGENVEPVPIENKLLEDAQINQVIVVGQDKKTLTALIWPNLEKIKEVSGIDANSSQDLNKNKELVEHITKIIKKQVSGETGFKGFERVSDFRFLPKAMEVGDEITNLFKMKRNVIADKYAKLIESMY